MNRKQARSRWAEILGHDAEITGHVGPKYPHRCAMLEFEGKSYRLKEAAARIAITPESS